jgi:hypothetical protein
MAEHQEWIARRSSSAQSRPAQRASLDRAEVVEGVHQIAFLIQVSRRATGLPLITTVRSCPRNPTSHQTRPHGRTQRWLHRRSVAQLLTSIATRILVDSRGPRQHAPPIKTDPTVHAKNNGPQRDSAGRIAARRVLMRRFFLSSHLLRGPAGGHAARRCR